MSALRIDLRNALAAIVASTLPEYNGNVVYSKPDKIEKGFLASVRLEDGSSSPNAMRKMRERQQNVTVSLFTEDASDIEAKLSEQTNLLEKAVEQAREEGAFGAITSGYLDSWSVDQDPAAKAKRGEVHLTFTFTYTESLA